MKMPHLMMLWLVMLLVGASLTLGGCRGAGTPPTKPEGAWITILPDLSRSNRLVQGGVYTDAAIQRVGKMILTQQSKDRVRIIPIGSRTIGRSVEALSMVSGRKNQRAQTRKEVEAKLHKMLAQSQQEGGDGTTNILHALRYANITCTPHSTVVILSDGLEQSESYSTTAALSARKPVQLPPPDTPYLKGCSVVFLGIGMSPVTVNAQDGETLPDAQLEALTTGWRDYFAASGVRPEDMTFLSIL